MTQLPNDLQGYIHVIQITVNAGELPKAFVCYIRPQRITSHISRDIVDDLIFESIQRKFPASTHITHKAILIEHIVSVTAIFHRWWPYAITVFLHSPLVSHNLDQQAISEPQSSVYNIPLNLFTPVLINEITQKIVNSDSPDEIFKLDSILEPYRLMLDRVYQVETDAYVIENIDAFPPVVDIKTASIGRALTL